MKDHITLTLRRGSWQISSTLSYPLPTPDALEVAAEELSFQLNCSWLQLPPKARAEFRRKWNISSTTKTSHRRIHLPTNTLHPPPPLSS